jgi:hypothetical protein
MEPKRSKRATVKQRVGGAKGDKTRLEKALVSMLVVYLRTQAQLDTAMKAIRNVVEGGVPIESLKPFLDEHVLLPRIAGVTKRVMEQARVVAARD